MKFFYPLLTVILLSSIFISCRSTRKLNSAIGSKDSLVLVNAGNTVNADSVNKIRAVMKSLLGRKIGFKTFSAKIKVDYEDSKGKQPDVNAFVRMHKDSIIWISVNASFLSIEAFRVLIKKDSIFILNKLEKIYEKHSLEYLQKIANIPLDFTTLQDLILGNPIYLDTSIVAFKQTENRILISTVGELFKSLLTITSNNNLVEKIKLDDIDPNRNRTADLIYAEYENKEGVFFSTARRMTISEKTKVDVSLKYKQWDFNKDLTYPFTRPKNYREK
ncbi:MAG: DUF4292 domain-containing protein [Chitinophagaceae bacterium]